MIVIEYKLKGKLKQYQAIDEAIRTCQFIRNKSIRYWMDNQKVSKYDLSKLSTKLGKEFDFAKRLNSTARQSSAERAWSAISKFYDNCRKNIKESSGFPKFSKRTRSVEYKQSGWKLDNKTKKHITFTDKNNIGRLKLIGSRDIYFYQPEPIKRVRIVRRADGYYAQFCISIELKEYVQATGKTIGLDVGLKEFYTDSNGFSTPNPRFYRTSEARLKKAHRAVSKKKKGSANRKKAIKKLGKQYLKISRQRNDHAVKLRIRHI